jgi:hypothetical protein
VQVIATTQLSLKLFSPETGLPSGFTRDAESLLVPGLGVAWIGGPSWRIALYFDSDGGRYVPLHLSSFVYADDGCRMAHLVSSHVPSRAKEAAFTMDVCRDRSLVDIALTPCTGSGSMRHTRVILHPPIGPPHQSTNVTVRRIGRGKTTRRYYTGRQVSVRLSSASCHIVVHASVRAYRQLQFPSHIKELR